MRLPWVLVAAVLALLLVPTVAACSFAGPGPDLPARLWVWDLEAAETVDQLDIWSRGLSGDCGLIHPVDLDAGRLVYADQAGDSMGVWLRLIGEDRPPRLVFRLDGRYGELDLYGDLLSIYMQTQRNGGHDRYDHIFTVDLTTGDAERVPLTVDWLGNPSIDDGILHWDWVDREDYRHRFNAYDLTTGTWVHENVSMQEAFGLGERARRTQMNADWILFSDHDGSHAWDRTGGRLHTIEGGESYLGGLDGDLLYRGGPLNVQVQRLPDGAPRDISEPEHPLFSGSAFDQGLTVLGTYSADGPKTPPSWMRDPDLTTDFPIPAEWRHERPPWYETLPAVPVSHVAFVLLSLAGALRVRGRRA